MLLAGLILALYRQDAANQRTLLVSEAEHAIGLQQQWLRAALRDVRAELMYLANQQSVQDFLADPDQHRGRLTQQFATFAEAHGVYDQVRILAIDGQELMRVDYQEGQAQGAPAEQLQSKRSRYYFQESRTLASGEMYVSPFDLNVEHGRIETPYEPVIRFLTPIRADEGQPRGLVALNFLGSYSLQKLEQISQGFAGQTMLLNPAGEYLQAPDAAAEWGWLLGHGRSFRSDYPAAWARVLDQGSGQFWNNGDLFCFSWLDPAAPTPEADNASARPEPPAGDHAMVVLTRIPAAMAQRRIMGSLQRLLLLAAGVAPVMLLLIYYWAKSVEERRQHAQRTAESEARLRQLSTALLSAQENERRSLSRVLHDELGQVATAIRLDLGSLARKHPELVGEGGTLSHAVQGADDLVAGLHEIASRSRPSVLDDIGLEDALISLFSEFSRRTGIEVDERLAFNQASVPVEVGENAYRIAAEAMANAGKYSGADLLVVEITQVNGELRLCVADQGKGFDAQQAAQAGRLGILGMRERAELLGGAFHLHTAPGRGTTVQAILPLEPAGKNPASSRSQGG